MSLSAGELYAISVTERTCSAISLFATGIMIVSFLSSRSFRKPISRLVFYASIGNIMANIATLISQSGIHAGTNTSLCQTQAFLLQWFMPADALWTFAMAFNVYLTVFYRYNPDELRRLEWKYLVLCYGLPFIPAFICFFISSQSRGRVYGSAILWCWITPSWDILRVTIFYVPVWFLICMTLAIYIRIGNLIWRRRRQLKEAGAIDKTVNPNEPPFSKVTDICITGEAANPFPLREIPLPLQRTPTFVSPENYTQRPYSVDVQGGNIVSSVNARLEPLRAEEPPEAPFEPHSYCSSSAPAPSEANSAAWAYIKYAMLFFVALLVTWAPSTINRIYAFVFPDSPNFALNYASSFVLPLQGFWNSLIYMFVSWRSFKSFFSDFRRGNCPSDHSAGHSGSRAI